MSLVCWPRWGTASSRWSGWINLCPNGWPRLRYSSVLDADVAEALRDWATTGVKVSGHAANSAGVERRCASGPDQGAADPLLMERCAVVASERNGETLLS